MFYEHHETKGKPKFHNNLKHMYGGVARKVGLFLGNISRNSSDKGEDR